jgi:hypothetical protein
VDQKLALYIISEGFMLRLRPFAQVSLNHYSSQTQLDEPKPTSFPAVTAWMLEAVLGRLVLTFTAQITLSNHPNPVCDPGL